MKSSGRGLISFGFMENDKLNGLGIKFNKTSL